VIYTWCDLHALFETNSHFLLHYIFMELVSDQTLMRYALDEARRAEAVDEVPIGCVVWHGPSQAIIGRGHNVRERDKNPVGHAEIIAIQQAAQYLDEWRLLECTLVVTLEPCPMCAGAIVNARVPRLIYGCDDPKAGAVRTLYQICDDPRLNHRVQITSGVLSEACGELLKVFFRNKRAAIAVNTPG
jgi:tRNA(adenine34) deaminase